MHMVYRMYSYGMTAARDEFEVPLTDARTKLGDLADEVRSDGHVIYLTRNGRRVGALVDPDMAARLNEMEDAYWSRRAAAVLDQNEQPLPWDEAVARLERGDTDA